MSRRISTQAAFSLIVLTGAAASTGCEAILGLKRAELLVADAGTGGATTTSHGTGGDGGAASCSPGETKACYEGPAATENVGICKSGTQTCKIDGSGFGDCAGQVTPQAETCAGPADEDCSGHDCVQWADLFGGVQYQGATAVGVDATTGDIFVAGSFAGVIPLEGLGKTLTSTSSSDVFLIKLGPSGKPVWAESFGASGVSAHVLSVAVGADGGVVIYGGTSGEMSFGGAAVSGPCLYAAKLSGSDGKFIWSQGFVSTALEGFGYLGGGRAMAVAPNGDVVVSGWFSDSDIDFGTGTVHHNGTLKRNAFLAKLNGSDGSALWSQAPCSDGASECDIDRLVVDAVRVHLGGSFSGSLTLGSAPKLTAAGTQDAVLAQLTHDGNTILQKQIGGAQSTVAVTGLAVDGLGGVVLGGRFTGSADFGGGSVASASGAEYIVRYGSDQAFVWAGFGDAAMSALGADTNGNILVAANPNTSFTFAGVNFPLSGDMFVAKLSSAGALVWSKLYKTGGDVSGLAVTQQGDPVLVGSIGDDSVDFGTGPLLTGGSNDAFVVKLSP